MDMQRFLIELGLLILLAGIAWPVLSRTGLGRLPGDIMIQRDGTNFYFLHCRQHRIECFNVAVQSLKFNRSPRSH